MEDYLDIIQQDGVRKAVISRGATYVKEILPESLFDGKWNADQVAWYLRDLSLRLKGKLDAIGQTHDKSSPRDV